MRLSRRRCTPGTSVPPPSLFYAYLTQVTSTYPCLVITPNRIRHTSTISHSAAAVPIFFAQLLVVAVADATICEDHARACCRRLWPCISSTLLSPSLPRGHGRTSRDLGVRGGRAVSAAAQMPRGDVRPPCAPHSHGAGSVNFARWGLSTGVQIVGIMCARRHRPREGIFRVHISVSSWHVSYLVVK
ncbi:hypothetical protein FB451DRAFT_238070 [Mycena latifolia]|nr:hypothetical protein FB451DRAFT_238070 [Mycena latifolia]